jgi:hypothetical protein
MSAAGVGTGSVAVVAHDGLKVDFLITRAAATLGP